MGRTLIEKIEANADVSYAVDLLTTDDLGEAKSEIAHPKARARQNVIFELGFFLGRLGRGRVCALYEDGVELPSDFSGVAWVRLDPGDGWKYLLARELRAAGIDADANRIK